MTKVGSHLLTIERESGTDSGGGCKERAGHVGQIRSSEICEPFWFSGNWLMD